MDPQEQLSRWMDGYVKAWNSNEQTDIEALFTDDARYRTEPYNPPWHGSAEIVQQWLAKRDEPGETRFSWQPILATPEVGVIEATTVYRTPPQAYSNLWVIHFAEDGRCSDFAEWWMKNPTNE